MELSLNSCDFYEIYYYQSNKNWRNKRWISTNGHQIIRVVFTSPPYLSPLASLVFLHWTHFTMKMVWRDRGVFSFSFLLFSLLLLYYVVEKGLELRHWMLVQIRNSVDWRWKHHFHVIDRGRKWKKDAIAEQEYSKKTPLIWGSRRAGRERRWMDEKVFGIRID